MRCSPGHLGQEVGQVVHLHLLEHGEQPLQVEPFDHAAAARPRAAPPAGRPGGRPPSSRPAVAAGRAGRARTVAATSLGCMSRRRAASAAISVVAEEAGHLVPVDDAVRGPADERPAAGQAHLLDRPLRAPRPSVGRRATSLTVSSPTRLSMMCRPTRISPALGLKGLTSRSQDRRRAPSLSSSAMRLAFTKTRRRWTEATNPMTSGGSAAPGRQEDDIFQLPDGDPIGGEQGQAHHPERVDEVAGHAPRLPPALSAP